MKRRILILPIAALVIAGLVQWRYSRISQHRFASMSTVALRQLAPRFELYDQHSRLVKFERYLGRTELVVVFCDGTDDPILTRLRDDYLTLKSAGFEVVAICHATPHMVRETERQSGIDYPFPVLSDIDRQSPIPTPVHRLWGLTGEDSKETRTGLFHVDRSGKVGWENGFPQPLDHPMRFIDDVTSGR